jgi:hypothetical protein
MLWRLEVPVQTLREFTDLSPAVRVLFHQERQVGQQQRFELV